MTQLTIKQMKDFLNYLNKYKHIVGLSDWTMLMDKEIKDGSAAFVECEPNIYEQTFKVTVYKDFLKEPVPKQKQMLLHELLHGRVNIYEKKIENLIDDEQEFMVCDFERGFASLIELTDEYE